MAKFVHVNLSRLTRFREAIARDLRQSGNGPIRKGLKQWAAIYRGFVQERFARMSHGGWAPLKKSTMLSRAKWPMARLRKALASGEITQAQFTKRAKTVARAVNKEAAAIKAGRTTHAKSTNATRAAGIRSHAILRDTGTLFSALSPTFSNKPGQYEQDIPFGVRVGYGGPAKHPHGRAAIADIASFHQTGAGPLPARPIVVRPDEVTIARMRDVMQDRINELAGS